ncbi:YunG family protein [Lysinibacillus xylanilyticus]|uniref:YunG family protein n=1 Tax=Lysinibacillus xylanilyticus TaxID=582475 RepID=UPI003CFDDF29
MYTENDLLKALRKSWSIQSSSKWSIDTPAKGQCGVTALVVYDILGGKIYKMRLDEGWHFYNFLMGNERILHKNNFRATSSIRMF